MFTYQHGFFHIHTAQPMQQGYMLEVSLLQICAGLPDGCLIQVTWADARVLTAEIATSIWWVQAPECILAYWDPQVGARIVEHPRGSCSGAALEEGGQHVQEDHWVEHLHTCTYV